MESTNRTALAMVAAAVAVTLGTALASASSPPIHAARYQTTWLISKNRHGHTPNGPSTHGVISGDRRYARVIAFQSEASDLVAGDTNRVSDVFAIRRAGSFGNDGSPWHGGKPILLSRGRHGKPANGPSFDPAVDGNFRTSPRCVAFLSAASNLVKGDTNGKVDAFLSQGPGDSLSRMSMPGGHQAKGDTTAVAVSGDCSHVAYLIGDRLYVRSNGHSTKIATGAADPSFAVGEGDDLVFGAGGDIYRSSGGTGHPERIASGRNPAYNSLKRHVVAYETHRGGHWQIAFRDLGQGQHVVTTHGGHDGNGDSRNPVLANSGYYIGFESDASNLGTNPNGDLRDNNRQPDTYLYTDTRKITLLESVDPTRHTLRGGGANPSVSYYANYFLFDSPAPLGTLSLNGDRQVFMRYLGSV
jgi:hypothetical protein